MRSKFSLVSLAGEVRHWNELLREPLERSGVWMWDMAWGEDGMDHAQGLSHHEDSMISTLMHFGVSKSEFLS